MRCLRIILFFLLCYNLCSAQQVLQIYSNRLGSFKKYEILVGEILDYKLKGERKFYSDRISGFYDSTIVFENGLEIKLSEIKCVRFKKNNHLVNAFKKYFLEAGILFLILDTSNNLILNRPKVVNEKALVISASLVAASFVLNYMGHKRVRFTKRKIIRIVNFDFQNLNNNSH